MSGAEGESQVFDCTLFGEPRLAAEVSTNADTCAGRNPTYNPSGQLRPTPCKRCAPAAVAIYAVTVHTYSRP